MFLVKILTLSIFAIFTIFAFVFAIFAFNGFSPFTAINFSIGIGLMVLTSIIMALSTYLLIYWKEKNKRIEPIFDI